jgi:predicted 3-demethylubiquinone-9 3-methyltransferase (glyoxalase superfamily)
MHRFPLHAALLALTFSAACRVQGDLNATPEGGEERVAPRIAPQLMFEGDGQAAIDLYTEVFDDAVVHSIERYGDDRPGGPAGTIYLAEIELAGQRVRLIDSPLPHDFTFTPSWSFFVDVESRDELTRLAERLGADGQVLMPMGDYGFSAAFTWVVDRFGVSWQLNLPR